MNVDLDPSLQIMFANADKDLSNEQFAEQILEKAYKSKSTRLVGWIGVVSVVFVLAWIFAAPLQDFALVISDGLAVPLVQPSGGWLMQILEPVNKVAGLLAFGLLVLQMLLRRILT